MEKLSDHRFSLSINLEGILQMREIQLFLTKKFNIESQYGIRRPTYPPYDRLENIARRLETTFHDLTYRLGESLFCFYLPKLQRFR
jgi:hypothetical protein